MTVPPIKLHFNGSTVTLIGDEFQEGELVPGTQNIRVRQRRAPRRAALTPLPTVRSAFPAWSLKSPLLEIPSFVYAHHRDTGSIHGNFGDLTAHGVPIDSNDKGLTLVGGFQIATFPLAEYIGAAVTVQLREPRFCSRSGNLHGRRGEWLDLERSGHQSRPQHFRGGLGLRQHPGVRARRSLPSREWIARPRVMSGSARRRPSG